MILSHNRRPIGLLKLGLVITSVALFLATGMLYVSQTRQQGLLTATIRSSGWVAYQAQLEFVKTEAEFAKLSLVPTRDGLRELVLRLEILRSRLPVLYDSDEGRVLSGIVDTKDLTQPLEATLDSVIDEVGALDAEDGETASRLRSIDTRLTPLGQVLQRILLESVAYNQEIFRRERALAETPGVVPLVLLFICGGCLALVLYLQGRRDRLRLGEILEAQNAIRAMESNLRAVIQAVPACVAVIEPESGRVSFFNSTAASLVSADPADPAWLHFVQAVHEAAGEAGRTKWGMLSMAYLRSPGQFVSLRGTICDVLWERRHQQLIVLADTTQVRSAELQVMQAAKLATLGEMATAIAHELNQPLAVIKMAVANARRLLEPMSGGEAVLAKLERISSQVDRAKRITDQVRRYGRMPSEQLLPFSLRHAVELAVSFVAEQYRAANIRLTIEPGFPMEVLVFGEQTMFEQVMVNLLINARDAFEARDAGAGPASREVTLSLGCVAEQVVISIQDNAGGVSEEMLPRLFEPFSTTKSTDKGTGLGLSLARSVVRDMNGTISVENVGAGARFIIALPFSPPVLGRNAA
ncbi:ATP-binding protein [Starkeya koreensis]|uniref:histidine kinase n=1 Tax=Ancylobacter koreensis TaxID=266121 RepID=A0ABT0DLB1_9HYPH|nr:ATP-binding protein [Ancylobacter koreensis]MCK0207887.1 ATP-binding protein [Ancylobacter koreensis]